MPEQRIEILTGLDEEGSRGEAAEPVRDDPQGDPAGGVEQADEDAVGQSWPVVAPDHSRKPPSDVLRRVSGDSTADQ